MLFRFLKSNSTFVLILTAILGIIMAYNNYYFLHENISPIKQTYENDMFLYQVLCNMVANERILSMLATLIVILQSFFLVRFNNQHRLIENQTYIFSFFFIIVANSFIANTLHHPFLFAQIFVVLAVDRLFCSFKKDNAVPYIFEASFFVAIGSLFYFNLIFLSIFIYLAVSNLRAFNWREWFIPLVGLSLPYLLLFSAYYILGKNISSIYQPIINNLQLKFYFTYPGFYLPFTFVILLISFIAMYNSIRLKGMKVSTRKYYTLLFWLSLFSICIAVISPNLFPIFLVLYGFPLSFFFSNLLLDMRNVKVRNILQWCILGFVIFYEILKIMDNA